jgi:dihydropteroate synthase
MGIINVTPDSFSDGALLAVSPDGPFRVSVDKALARAEAMVRDGAALLDVGGESTRPGAVPVSAQEELERVMPVIEALAGNLDTPLSVDTSSPAVMREACRAGAVLINDVRALRREGALEAARECEAAVCLMHMRDEPGTMQQKIHYDDVVGEVLAFLKDRMARATGAGIDRARLLVDPGFGFGKTLENNYRLLRELDRFAELDLPLLVGVSRKSMIGGVLDRPPQDRLAGSLAAACWAVSRGANIIRTHDVAATRDVIKIHSAIVRAG